MSRIAAIVVTYNRKELLKQCLEKLQNQSVSLDILVIDNASTDGTEELFQNVDKNIVYYNTGSNLGGAGGFNYGMRKAYELGYDLFWLMDDDTLPYENALEELLKAKDELGNTGFLSSVAVWNNGELCNMNIQRTGINKKDIDYSRKYNSVIMATFVSFFVSREIVKEFGLPITDFVIWSDDLEYSRRISKKYPCYVVSTSKVLHKMGSNAKVGIETEEESRLWRYKLVYRNEVFVFRREGIKGWFYLVSRMLLHSLRIILKGNNKKMQKVCIIWKSFFEGLRFNPVIEMIDK